MYGAQAAFVYYTVGKLLHTVSDNLREGADIGELQERSTIHALCFHFYELKQSPTRTLLAERVKCRTSCRTREMQTSQTKMSFIYY